MDKNLIKVYLILLVSFLAISPFIHLKDIWISDLSKYISKTINGEIEDLKMKFNFRPCPPPKETFKRLDPTKAKVLFVLDDNWGTQYYFAYQVLKEKGFPATIAVIPNEVNRPGYMTKAQLEEVYLSGWDLVNHTFSHQKLSTLDKEEQEKEIIRGTNWLQVNCFHRGSKIVVYPYGAYNQTTLDILQEHGYHGARTLQTGFEKNRGYLTYEAKIYNLTTDVETEWAKDWIDQAIEEKKTLIFVNHRFANNATDDPTGMVFDKKKFREIVDYLDQLREKVEVITYSEWINQVDR